MNRVYLRPKNKIGGEIPLISLSPKLESNNNHNRSMRLENLINESLEENGYLEFNNLNFRKLIGIKHRISQDLAMRIINQYLDSSHFEREKNEMYVFCGKGERHNNILDLGIVGSIKGYCVNCEQEDRDMKVRVTHMNRVSIMCDYCQVWDSYIMVEE